VRKSPSPKIAPSKFERELVSTMRSVLDAAIDQIDVANRTPATKAKMAQRILRAASDGRMASSQRIRRHHAKFLKVRSASACLPTL
jgi:hypothetical protein